MIEQLEMGVPDIVGFKFSGKLVDKDCKQMEPRVEEILQREGKVKLFAELEDFHGMDWHAVWDELKFGVRHYRDIERIAMVGDKKWEKTMSDLFKPFTKADVRYFDKSRTNAAWYWLQEEDHQ
jgi:hypothetical protein